MRVEVISLIYKSTQYLDFIVGQLKAMQGVDIRVVANDASQNVLDYLSNIDIPYTIYNDPYPEQYYLNRVYRCWNYCVQTSKSELVCLVNSDMYFSDGWLQPLIDAHDIGLLPTSRLVESGKKPSGKHGVSKNFGRHPNSFNKDGWLSFADSLKKQERHDGGLYMPVIFERQEFINCGMYPEGNIFEDGVGTLNGPVIQSGDSWFFQKIPRKHITCFDSVVYHIQEGELDE